MALFISPLSLSFSHTAFFQAEPGHHLGASLIKARDGCSLGATVTTLIRWRDEEKGKRCTRATASWMD